MSHAIIRRKPKANEAWDQILLRVVQVQGPDILRKLIKQATQSADRIKNDLPAYESRNRVEKAALDTLSGMGFLGGLLFGLQLPQLDLKLSARGKERDALVLHAASLLVTRVGVDWVQEILRQTLAAPTLSDKEARFLRAISKVLDSSLKGVERGWSARQIVGLWIRFKRSPVSKQHHVATDSRALRILQEWIERLGSG